MNLTPIRVLLGAIVALFTLTGCKVNVTGHGRMTDPLSKNSQAIAIEVDSRNRGRDCEVSVTLSDEQGNELFSAQTDPLIDAADGSLSIDTGKSGCEPQAKAVLVAQARHRIIGTELVERQIPCYPGNPQLERLNVGTRPIQTVRTRVNTIVTDVQGEIRDRASGQVLRTFTATSEPRQEAVGNDESRGRPVACR